MAREKKKKITMSQNFQVRFYNFTHHLASGDDGEKWLKSHDKIINIYLLDYCVIKIYIPIKQPLEG